MDCNCEGYIRGLRVISEAYPSTARSRIKSSLNFVLGDFKGVYSPYIPQQVRKIGGG